MASTISQLAIAINENEIKIKSDKIIYNRKNKSLNAFGKVLRVL